MIDALDKVFEHLCKPRCRYPLSGGSFVNGDDFHSIACAIDIAQQRGAEALAHVGALREPIKLIVRLQVWVLRQKIA